MSSPLEDLRAILNKLAKIATKLDVDSQEAFLQLLESTLQQSCETFDIDPESLIPPPAPEALSVSDSNAEDNDDDDDDYDSTKPLIVTQKLLNNFKQIEILIAEKLYQQGKASYDLFARFDKTNSGSILPIEFLAAVTSIGVNVYPKELRLLAYKFPAESDSAADGAIDYETFLQYAEALRAQPRSTVSQSFSRTLADRAATPGAVKTVDAAAAAMRKVKLSVEAKLQLGLKAMRAHMYSRTVALPTLFKQIRSDDQVVSVDVLAKEVIRQGFPSNLLTDAELKEVLSKCASAKNNTALTYSDFFAFFQGKQEADGASVSAKKKDIITDPTVVSAFIKLNSLPLRAHFKSIDEDLDGFVSVQEVIDDLCSMGMRGALKHTPELEALVASYAVKTPGKLQYSDYVQFANARVNAPLQPAAPKELSVEVPSSASAIDLVHILHEHGNKGISWESVFSAFADVSSSMITEEDLWHALTSTGFQVARETVASLFALFDPDADAKADYKEIAVTILYPNRNPRMGASRNRKQPGGEDTVPLGTGIERLHAEFRPQTAPSKVSVKKYAHSHKFDNEGQTEEEEATAAAKAARGVRPVNLSTLKLTDPVAGDVVPPQSLGSTRRNTEKGSQQTKGSIDFGGDHGGAPARVERTRIAPGQTFHINEEPDEVVANEAPATYRASDVFNRAPESPKAPRRSMRAPPTPGMAHKSVVSFNQADTEEYVPQRARVAPPGGRSSVQIGHSDEAEVEMRVTGHSRRSIGSMPQSSVSLRHDASNEESAAIPLCNTTKGARKHFDANSARGSVDHLGEGAQVADTPYILKRQTRAKGASAPSSHSAEDFGADSNDAQELVKRIDALVLSPRPAKSAAPAADSEEDSGVQAISLDFDDAETPAAGALDYDLIAELAKNVYASGKAKKVFSDWSKGSNLVTKDHFADGSISSGVRFSDDQIDVVFEHFDKDGKGALSFSEFIRLLAAKQQ